MQRIVHTFFLHRGLYRIRVENQKRIFRTCSHECRWHHWTHTPRVSFRRHREIQPTYTIRVSIRLTVPCGLEVLLCPIFNTRFCCCIRVLFRGIRIRPQSLHCPNIGSA